MSDRPGPPPEPFLVTKEYRRFAEFADACRRYRYIGVCHGPPGVGKTLSAHRYARWDLIEPMLAHYFSDAPRPPDAIAGRSVVYTARVASSPNHIAHDIHHLCFSLNWIIELALHPSDHRSLTSEEPQHVELLLIDEADRLKLLGLEQVRDEYDRRQLGVILIGMPGLEKRLARYPQLYSRVGFVHEFRPLSSDELRSILEHKWDHLGLTLTADEFTDTEAMAAITRITGGNFRLIQRLFAQIERILQINELRTVTKEVVDAARERLVIGPL